MKKVIAIALALVMATTLVILGSAEDKTATPELTISGYEISGMEDTDIVAYYMLDDNTIVEPEEATQLILRSRVGSFTVNGSFIEYDGKTATVILPLPVGIVEEEPEVTPEPEPIIEEEPAPVEPINEPEPQPEPAPEEKEPEEEPVIVVPEPEIIPEPVPEEPTPVIIEEEPQPEPVIEENTIEVKPVEVNPVSREWKVPTISVDTVDIPVPTVNVTPEKVEKAAEAVATITDKVVKQAAKVVKTAYMSEEAPAPVEEAPVILDETWDSPNTGSASTGIIAVITLMAGAAGAIVLTRKNSLLVK